MSESSQVVGSTPRFAALDYVQLCQDGPSEEAKQRYDRDEDAAWSSIARRSRSSRALWVSAQKGVCDTPSRSTTAENESGNFASCYALLSSDEGDDYEEDGNMDEQEEMSTMTVPRLDAAAGRHGRKGSKAGKERAGSGKKTMKSRASAEDEQEWPQEAEFVVPKTAYSMAAPSAEERELCGRFANPTGCSAGGGRRLGDTARCSGSAPSAMATMAFAAELLAIVAGIAPEAQETQVAKGRRRAQPRPQPALAMHRLQRSSRGSVRKPLTYARGARR